MKKILFLHGFYASGQCPMAQALSRAFSERAEVLTPDLPQHPQQALEQLRRLIDQTQPDLLVGNSCGAFYAQQLAPVVGIPALLGNPHFCMSAFLQERIGTHTYKSPRKDGQTSFVIDAPLIEAFAQLEATQFSACNPYYQERVWGLFGQADTLAHYESLFLQYYSHSYHFPGAHTPTEAEVLNWYVPLAEQQLEQYPRPADGKRYFQHFKGGHYRYVGTAFHSETRQRMVVYQALYGEQQYWVRPESMFFETIERDGRQLVRFQEVEKF